MTLGDVPGPEHSGLPPTKHGFLCSVQNKARCTHARNSWPGLWVLATQLLPGRELGAAGRLSWLLQTSTCLRTPIPPLLPGWKSAALTVFLSPCSYPWSCTFPATHPPLGEPAGNSQELAIAMLVGFSWTLCAAATAPLGVPPPVARGASICQLGKTHHLLSKHWAQARKAWDGVREDVGSCWLQKLLLSVLTANQEFAFMLGIGIHIEWKGKAQKSDLLTEAS